MQSLGIVGRVTEPTSWFSSFVIIQEPKGKIRVCIDPKDLDKVRRRSHYLNPTHEDILPELARAKVFSVVDAKNGFWHVELDDDSSHLAFNSPFGRFCWRRMPFSLCSALEEFQRRLNHGLDSLTELIKVIKASWPETKGELSHLVLPFFDVRDELSVIMLIVGL